MTIAHVSVSFTRSELLYFASKLNQTSGELLGQGCPIRRPVDPKVSVGRLHGIEKKYALATQIGQGRPYR